MEFKYGTLPQSQVHAEKIRLQGAIYKLLPYKEEGYELLDKYFSALLTRINGLNSLFMGQPEIITLMSILEASRYEMDFDIYRKNILDACSLVNDIKECDS